MSSICSYVFGHYSTYNFEPTGIGVFTGLQSYILNLYSIMSTYFLWFNQSFLFIWSLLISIPKIKFVATRSFISNWDDNWDFTPLIISLLFPINRISSTYNNKITKWSLTCLKYMQWSYLLRINPSPNIWVLNFWYHILGDYLRP